MFPRDSAPALQLGKGQSGTSGGGNGLSIADGRSVGLRVFPLQQQGPGGTCFLLPVSWMAEWSHLPVPWEAGFPAPPVILSSL